MRPGVDGPGADGPGADGPGVDGPGVDGPGVDGAGLSAGTRHTAAPKRNRQRREQSPPHASAPKTVRKERDWKALQGIQHHQRQAQMRLKSTWKPLNRSP
ncbi:unnamed protein product [Lota lota]